MQLLILSLFIGIPLVEIYLFIQIGGLVGTWPPIALVILTAFIGTCMLRQQGVATLARAQAELGGNRFPVRELFNGFCLLVSGIMLLTPGFLTDALGFTLLLPALRTLLGRGIWELFARSSNARFPMHGANPNANGGQKPDTGPVLDGEEFGVERDDSAQDQGAPRREITPE